ncbi:Threonylcarbamoyladenosine tRNA methylthiotransferase [Chamberlinius hualienensis]
MWEVTTCAGSELPDIEDLYKDATDIKRDGQRQYVYPKAKRIKVKKTVKQEIRPEIIADSVIPGSQTIYVKTWGCTHNSSDSEYMAGQLASYGYKITEMKEEADLWLLNSCTVKNPAEDHFRNEINAGRASGKFVVVAGCVAQSVPSVTYLKGLSIIGVQQIDRVVEVVEETLKGNSVRLLGKKKEGKRKTGGATLDLPKIRRNALVEIIAISTGCLNQCTYCKTKHARGELGSYPPQQIVQRAQQAFQEGVCELWVTSEDTGAYGRDIGSSLPELLWQLIDVIPDGCMLRVGMTNPPYILDHLEEMGKILDHPKVYSFLHLPVQSASDSVLSDMKREYCRADFEKVVDTLNQKVPGITIATDVICGFPTETEEDFEETIDLVQKYKFPSLFINQFYPRPGTPAARMNKIPTTTVKQRTKRISEVFASYAPYEHKLGQIQSVLVTDLSTDKLHYVGHNKYYEQVLVPKVEEYMGRWIKVKITKTGKHYLQGEPVASEDLVESNKVQPLPKGAVSGVVISKSTKTPKIEHLPLILAIVFVSWALHKISCYLR